MKLLGVTDLAKRWNYTKQGVHQKLKVSVRGTRPCYLIHSSLTFQGRRSSMRLAL